MFTNLTVNDVAEICGVHRNTILNYEKRGYLNPKRDLNNYRRFHLQDAKRLRKLLRTRKNVVETG